MLQVFVIIFREILEITLILGLVLAATPDVKNRLTWIVSGIVLGIIGSTIIAVFTSVIAQSFEGVGQDYFNAGLVSTVTIFLVWTVIWMESNGKKLSLRLKNHNKESSSIVLMLIITATIFREGAEIVLFTYGAYTASSISLVALFLGTGLGILAGLSFGMAIYFGIFSFGPKLAFKICTILLSLVAAGMATQTVKLLNSSGLISLLSDPLWNSSNFIRENSLLGEMLNVLVGYNSQPTPLQLIVYISTLTVIWSVSKFKNYRLKFA